MAKAKFYITERSNPQLRKSYFNARGQKSIKEINKYIDGTLYGSQSIYGAYETEDEYNTAIRDLKAAGYNVYNS